MSVSLEVAEYLEGEGVGTFGGDTQWSLHTTREPLSPDDVVTIYNTGGGEPVTVEDTDDETLYNPTIQVRVRGTDQEAVHARHELIRRTLILPREREIGDHRYVSINATSDILDLGLDDNERYVATMNYDVLRHPLEAS